jgi:alkaline phosphatase
MTYCATIVALVLGTASPANAAEKDFIRDLQTAAVKSGESSFGHWGIDPKNYTAWATHTNRLVPVYTYGTCGAGRGIDLTSYIGPNSAYRSERALRRIYGYLPTNTVNPNADYMDQTDVAALQRAAFAGGKKYVFLVIFDGMDWETTRAAAIYNRRRVSYHSGRGVGTHFQEYTACGTTQFGYMVVSPHNEGTETNVNEQSVLNPGGKQPGGYNVAKGGPHPWTSGDDPVYLMGRLHEDPKSPGEHAFPDSAPTATALMAGVKTYNGAINVDPTGNRVSTVAHEVQWRGFSVGVVTSVPVSHATPACAYAHNVHRDDYQDLTRDLLGLPSISHPQQPLPGVDVLIGGGFDDNKLAATDKGQGDNFVPGNVWITAGDLKTIDAASNGKYVVALRTPRINGAACLMERACQAAHSGKRLFGFYGVGKAKGHLPFQTADGDYRPVRGNTPIPEQYTAADLYENPRLADMTAAAITVLQKNPRGFWLMVEAGDVDWANHNNNLDNAIGAVNSGDLAVKTITNWVDAHSNWNESLLIVTADHGHYLVLEKPELLTGKMSNVE